MCNGSLVTGPGPATEGPLALAIDPHEELAPGTWVGGYEVERLIGFGGMGVVYGAVHPVIGKRAAIKVLNAKFCADHEAVDRFVREAQAVNKIGHANIVDIFAIGELDDGRSFLVMEWLKGETLMDRLEREPLSSSETISITISLTRALEAAHTAGVIHRDLKPENVFLLPEDDTFRVKLLDFGIAKLETRRAPTRKTATGMTVGTPLFMSPEQAKGNAIDGRTDIYSLGVLAYAMVCRTTPFENEASPVEVLHAHISKPPRPPSEIVATTPPALEALILQMLAKRPEDRPSIKEIRTRLKSIGRDSGSFETFSSETPVPSRRAASAPLLAPAPSGETVVLSRRRSPWPVVAGLGALVAGVALFFVLRGPSGDGAARAPSTTVAEPAQVPAGVPAAATPPQVPAGVPAAATPPPALAPGTVELVIEPATARVRIGDTEIALDGGRARVELVEGDYVVATTAPGYRAVEQPLAVTSAAVTPLAIKLTKLRGRAVKTKTRPRDVDAVVDPFGQRRKRK